MAGARGRRGGGALLPLAVLAGLAAGAAAGSGAGDQGTTTLGVYGEGRHLLQQSNSTGNDAGLINDYVRRSGTRFVVQAANGPKDACETFYFAGANAYYMMAFAADPARRFQVLEILDAAKDLGLKVLRMWAFDDGPAEYNALQRYPGMYDEATLQGLDWTIDQASRRGIRVVLVFANYWSMYGGIDQYNIWSFQAGAGTCNGDVSCRDDFYSDPVASGYYKDHVRTLLTRKNTVNGRVYREDPSIFGYNLMNEPRSQKELYIVRRKTTDGSKIYNISYNQANDLQSWIEDMASYVKSIDPIHLLSTGQEGFAGNSTPLYMYSNPGAWASLLGVDLVRNNKAPGIDYATIHVYVDQWLCVAEGSTTEGQLDFLKTWIEARQQAGEEELGMPVVLEEFGSKIAQRVDQYKLAYDSCLQSAKRGGSCAGVMFWDLTHKEYAALDPWLDGQLRFGGGYSNWMPAASSEMSQIFDLAKNYASSVAAINAANGGKSTCVWNPIPQMGRGCKDLAINLDEGAMPWTCLPGEPSNINWCNAQDQSDLYHNPPAAWRGASYQALPYNAIEVLILGNITNKGSTPLNLKGSWIIVPFSMGVQTQFEGIWKREPDPNNYFTIYCWYMGASGVTGGLCNSTIHVSFTNFTWPIGVKRDRGVNISFVDDLILPPGGMVSGSDPSNPSPTSVAISFKDAKNNFRLDVSSLGLKGSNSCPTDPILLTLPAPPPPLPLPCTVGPDPRRGCPGLEWYWAGNQSGNANPLNTILNVNAIPTYVVPSGSNAAAPAPIASTASATAGRRLQQNVGGMAQTNAEGVVPAKTYTPVAKAATNVLMSVSTPVSADSVGLTAGTMYILMANVAISGSPRTPANVTATTGSGTARTGADTPHPDPTGGALSSGVDTMIVMQYTPRGVNGVSYKVLAMSKVIPNSGASILRGVVDLADVTNATIYAEVPMSGLSVTMTGVKLYDAASLSTAAQLPSNITDEYQPCIIDPSHGYTAVYEVGLDGGRPSDTLSIELCSPGGYDQYARVYANGKMVTRTDVPGQTPIFTLVLPVVAGTKYLIVLNGDMGDPYGGYRGHPGVRMRWKSGNAFATWYDAAPIQGTANGSFVQVQNGDLVIDCKKAAYVGCNTWDLMDKSRYEAMRPEIIKRLDSMVQAGWSVGRTWGFSLGTGLSNGPLGKTVADPSKILETAPGVYNEEVFASLDWVLNEAAKRKIRLIIPIEDYWLSMDRYVNWSSTALAKNDFYTDWKCRQMYKAHLKVFTHRINTVNGRMYKEDPTIFFWDLMNEPRCTGCGFALQAWVEEMALYLKAIDPNHLVTIGEEGFYSTTCDRAFLNPGNGKRRTGISSSPWAAQEGQDFLANHVIPSIDLSTTHIWPDNWLGYADWAGTYNNDDFDYTHGRDFWKEKLDYLNTWLAAHIVDAKKLGKPLIVEEFGKAVSAAKVYTGELPHSLEQGETISKDHGIRDLFMQAVYDQVGASAKDGGPAQGSNFWNLYTVGTGTDDPYQITLADTTTMGVIHTHMENISSLATESESTCSSSSDSSHAGSFSTGWAASGTQGPLITFAPAGGPSQFIPIVQSQGNNSLAPSSSTIRPTNPLPATGIIPAPGTAGTLQSLAPTMALNVTGGLGTPGDVQVQSLSVRPGDPITSAGPGLAPAPGPSSSHAAGVIPGSSSAPALAPSGSAQAPSHPRNSEAAGPTGL